VALGIEDRQCIRFPFGDAERCGGFVQVHGLALGVVHASPDRELAVDEHPKVVVTGKREGLAAVVQERGVKLGGEFVVEGNLLRSRGWLPVV